MRAKSADRERCTGELAGTIELGQSEALRLSAYGVLLAFLGIGAFSAIANTDMSTARGGGMVVVFLATVVVHELVHALFFKLFGGSPRFGIGASWPLPCVYTTSEGDRFDSRQMVTIGLAPIILISVAALAFARLWPAVAPYAFVALVTNCSGSVGDLWIVSAVLRFARLDDVSFEDRLAGIAVWTQDPAGSRVFARAVRRTSPSRRFFAHSAVAALTIFLLTPAVGVLLTGGLSGDDALRIGPAVFPLVEVTSSEGGGSIGIGVGPSICWRRRLRPARRVGFWTTSVSHRRPRPSRTRAIGHQCSKVQAQREE